MFRLASTLKPEDDGMEEILQTNDDLLRVMDTYKRVVGVGGGESVGGGGGGGNLVENGTQSGAGVGKTQAEKPEEAGAVGGGTGLAMGGAGGGGGGGDASTLIDLADLDFGTIPTTGMTAMTPNTADSLLDALGTLGKQAPLVYMYTCTCTWT